MQKQTQTTETDVELPYIDRQAEYTTREAAVLLGQSADTLASWRRRGAGPRYRQNVDRGTVKYRGSWLEDFRDRSFVTPEN